MNKENTSNNKSRYDVQKIIYISILTSLGVIFSIVDKQISFIIFPFLPTAKIGLANIVILLGVVSYDFSDALIMTIMKSLLVSLILGSINAFVIGFTGSLFALLAMELVKNTFKDKVSCIGISVAGGFFHILGQLLVTNFLYQLGYIVFLYGSLLILLSLVTSILVGIIANRLINYI